MSGRVSFGGRGIFFLVFFFHNSLYLDCRDYLFFGATGDELLGTAEGQRGSAAGRLASRDSSGLYLGGIYPFLLHGNSVGESRVPVIK